MRLSTSSKSGCAMRMTPRREYAVREGTTVLTKDEDFPAQRLREPYGPTVIWLRVGNCSRAALVCWLTPLLASIEALGEAGESVIEVR